jgi:hypothetical protein
MEVFFCSAPHSAHRAEIATQMRAIWSALDGVKLVDLTPRILGCDHFSFQKLRRAAADVMAKNEFYILTDDDCEPITDFNIALGAIREHPEFAILSAWPENASIQRWTPEDYTPYEDLAVMEHHSTGGIRMTRRGSMIKGWPEQLHNGYDAEHCQWLRHSGYRVGYSQHFRMIHHGEGKNECLKSLSQAR